MAFVTTVLVSVRCSWRSQWPHHLGRRSVAARLLGLRVRIPPVAWQSVSCECCELTGRGLCVGLMPRPEETCRVVCVCVCLCVFVCVFVCECVCVCVWQRERESLIKWGNNPLHLQWVDTRGQTKKEETKKEKRKKEKRKKEKERKKETVYDMFQSNKG
jgi:hypothetical protein